MLKSVTSTTNLSLYQNYQLDTSNTRQGFRFSEPMPVTREYLTLLSQHYENGSYAFCGGRVHVAVSSQSTISKDLRFGSVLSSNSGQVRKLRKLPNPEAYCTYGDIRKH